MANYMSSCFFSNPPCVKPKPLFTVTCCRSASHGSGSNFYELLSLTSKNAGTEDIKRAYRTLALKYHPDVCDDEDATKTFVLLHTAYTTLMDPVLREDYDSTLVGCRDQPAGHVCVGCAVTDQVGERRWEVQIMELKKRSTTCYGKEGSWGSRMRFKALMV
ncbi:dnaJ homolog subfamily B member 14-like [Cynara cardunculus var. scolymus]|uniref:dnaJ homolog subfamily B member 14-like n=1 Tax=Cynara cardunculus var. scolymus TaxID=59895 RepID=UPI000D62B48F|nr:dnaJ homolog subfamily B member 14-like [Cynara cardunculus var. scolymus]